MILCCFILIWSLDLVEGHCGTDISTQTNAPAWMSYAACGSQIMGIIVFSQACLASLSMIRYYDTRDGAARKDFRTKYRNAVLESRECMKISLQHINCLAKDVTVLLVDDFTSFYREFFEERTMRTWKNKLTGSDVQVVDDLRKDLATPFFVPLVLCPPHGQLPSTIPQEVESNELLWRPEAGSTAPESRETKSAQMRKRIFSGLYSRLEAFDKKFKELLGIYEGRCRYVKYGDLKGALEQSAGGLWKIKSSQEPLISHAPPNTNPGEDAEKLREILRGTGHRDESTQARHRPLVEAGFVLDEILAPAEADAQTKWPTLGVEDPRRLPDIDDDALVMILISQHRAAGRHDMVKLCDGTWACCFPRMFAFPRHLLAQWLEVEVPEQGRSMGTEPRWFADVLQADYPAQGRRCGLGCVTVQLHSSLQEQLVTCFVVSIGFALLDFLILISVFASTNCHDDAPDYQDCVMLHIRKVVAVISLIANSCTTWYCLKHIDWLDEVAEIREHTEIAEDLAEDLKKFRNEMIPNKNNDSQAGKLLLKLHEIQLRTHQFLSLAKRLKTEIKNREDDSEDCSKDFDLKRSLQNYHTVLRTLSTCMLEETQYEHLQAASKLAKVLSDSDLHCKGLLDARNERDVVKILKDCCAQDKSLFVPSLMQGATPSLAIEVP
eukprot:TRINITY_DN31856_c0_g1_i1.p1 TRINITY_DN31856_c0_g1~~TRINITY_DN31856_c0_g1_i1.p1  ORF type:complete len:665 (+),score=97.36 TRINITY_DN31856_c0_g1_i1:118-2112(+)